MIDVRAQPDVPAWTVTASAAAAAGVRRFIPSDFVLNLDNSACADLYPENRQRCEVRRHLIDLAGKNPGFSWTSVTNGPFLDWVSDSKHEQTHKLPTRCTFRNFEIRAL